MRNTNRDRRFGAGRGIASTRPSSTSQYTGHSALDTVMTRGQFGKVVGLAGAGVAAAAVGLGGVAHTTPTPSNAVTSDAAGTIPALGNGTETELWVWPTGNYPDDPLNIQWAIDNGAQTGTLTINLGEGEFLCGDPGFNNEVAGNFVDVEDSDGVMHRIYKHHSKDGSIFIHGNREVILKGAPSTSTGPDGKPAPATTIERGYCPITIGLKPRYKTNPNNPDFNGDPYDPDFNFGWAPDYFVREVPVNDFDGNSLTNIWTNYRFHIDVMGTVYDDLVDTDHVQYDYPPFMGDPELPENPDSWPSSPFPYDEPVKYRAIVDLNHDHCDITPDVTFGIEGIRIHYPKGDPFLFSAGSGGYIKNCHFDDARPADVSAWLFHHQRYTPSWMLTEWPLSLVQFTPVGLKSRPYLGEPEPAPVENVSGDVYLIDNYFDSKVKMSVVDSNQYKPDGTPNTNYGRPILADPFGNPIPGGPPPFGYIYDPWFNPAEFKECVDYFPKTADNPNPQVAYRVRGININFCNCCSATNVYFERNVIKGCTVGWYSNCFWPHMHNENGSGKDNVPCANIAETTQILDNDISDTCFGPPPAPGQPPHPDQPYYAGFMFPSIIGTFPLDFGALGMLPEHTAATVSGNTVNILSKPPSTAFAIGLMMTYRTNASVTNNTFNTDYQMALGYLTHKNSNCIISHNTFTGKAAIGQVCGPGSKYNTYKNNDASGLVVESIYDPSGNLVFPGVQLNVGSYGAASGIFDYLEGNTFTNNVYGASDFAGAVIQGASYNTFTNENFVGNYPGWLVPFPIGLGCMMLVPAEIPFSPYLVRSEGNKITALKNGANLQGFDLCNQIVDLNPFLPVPPFPAEYTPNNIVGYERCENVPPEVLASLMAKMAEFNEAMKKLKLPYM